MIKLFDRVKVNIPTTGTGDITFGAVASTAFLTPTEAGVLDGDEVRYVIVDGLDFEEGVGLIKDTVATMGRTVTKSKIGGVVGTSPINLSGTAVLALTASAADILTPDDNLASVEDADAALDNLGGTTVGKALFMAEDADAALDNLGGEPRQNAALDRIYQSKILGVPRRVINAWATGFKSATDAGRGIDTGSSSNIDTSNAATNGYINNSQTPTQVPQGTGIAIGNMTDGGGVSAAFDGNSSKADTVSAVITSSSTGYVGKNYTSSPKAIAKANIYGSNNTGYWGGGISSGTAYLYASNSAPTTYNDGTLLGSVAIPTDTNTTEQKEIQSSDTTSAWNYVWVALVGNTSGNIALAQVQFFEVIIEDGIVVTAQQETDNIVSSGRTLIEFDPVESPVLDTDIVVEMTCDGGANWAVANMVLVSEYSQNGRVVAETSDTICSPGTSFAARISISYGKSVPIHGVSVTVR